MLQWFHGYLSYFNSFIFSLVLLASPFSSKLVLITNFFLAGEFHVPEKGELFDEIVHVEMDEKNTEKTVRDYKSDGSRAKRLGRDEQAGSKRKRYDEQRSSYDRSRDSRFSGKS